MQGTTDSEACFALILSLIEPELLAGGECVPVAVLRKAMLSAIATLRGFLADAGVVEGASTVLSVAGHEWHVVTASASNRLFHVQLCPDGRQFSAAAADCQLHCARIFLLHLLR